MPAAGSRWTPATEQLVVSTLRNEPDRPDGLEEFFPDEDYDDARRVLAALTDAGLLHDAQLTFAAVSQTNRTRCERWHPGFPNDGTWTGADWSNAMAGEAGETCNIVKKLRRLDAGMQQAAGDTRDTLLVKLATEIGDTFIYLDLLAQYYGLDTAQCVANTFNRVSQREGFPERLAGAEATT